MLSIKPRPYPTNILQTFGQTFVKHPKYPTNMFLERKSYYKVLEAQGVCEYKAKYQIIHIHIYIN
jgi:hypothetical protein